MRKVINGWVKILTAVSVFTLFCAIALNAYEIFVRYLFGKSIYWIQDGTQLLMMWFIFPGIVAVAYSKNDLIVDIFINRTKPKLRRILEIVINIILCVFCAFLTYQSYLLFVSRIGKKTSIAGIPMICYTGAILLAAISLFIVYALFLYDWIRNPEKMFTEDAKGVSV